jgi:predicted DNA-binding protein
VAIGGFVVQLEELTEYISAAEPINIFQLRLWTYSNFCITVLLYYIQLERRMAMSVRLDPTLETRVEQESRRLGITKSEFVKDALERVLGLKNPADLLRTVRSGKPMGNPQASRNVSARMKAKLRAKLPD